MSEMVHPTVTVVLAALTPVAVLVAVYAQARYEVFEDVPYRHERARAAWGWGVIWFFLWLFAAVCWPVVLPCALLAGAGWVIAEVGARG